MTIEQFLSEIDVSQERKSAIAIVLQKLDPQILERWLGKVVVHEQRVVGTYYAELAQALSYSDYVSLYEALGYNFRNKDVFEDMLCVAADSGCTPMAGYTCDTDTCHP